MNTPGPELLRSAFASAWGKEAAALFIGTALAAFGFSTVLGCYVSGERCASWLGLEERGFRLLYLLCCLLGGLEPLLNPVWVMLFDGETPGILALIGGIIGS